jgi:invasion protein IalB
MKFISTNTMRIAAAMLAVSTSLASLAQAQDAAAPAAPAAAPAAPAAAPAGNSGPPQGWFKVCTKQEDNDVCIVQNLLTANSGQLITAVGLITVTGKVNRKLMQVSVPSARIIPAGIGIQIDNGKAQKLDYAVCMPDKCVAEIPLTDAMISSLKKGTDVVFTSVNFQRAPNPIKMSLNGFAAAFDGDPIEQSKLEERQKLLQEEMQKKAEDRRKQLEDAQKAAKQQ